MFERWIDKLNGVPEVFPVRSRWLGIDEVGRLRFAVSWTAYGGTWTKVTVDGEREIIEAALDAVARSLEWQPYLFGVFKVVGYRVNEDVVVFYLTPDEGEVPESNGLFLERPRTGGCYWIEVLDGEVREHVVF